MTEGTETPTVLLMSAADKACYLRDRATRLVVLDEALTVRVRSVGVDEVLAAAKLPPDIVGPDDTQDDLRQKIVDALFGDDRIQDVFDIVITKGMVEPRVWQGPNEPCPYEAGYVELQDLAPHRTKLFGAIFMGGKRDRDVVNAATFRGGAGAGAAAVEPVRPVAADSGSVPAADETR